MSWKPLKASNASSIPPLIVKHNFTPTGYTVSISDFCYIWTETLDRRAVIRRALNENTSIDPSEDGSQLKILLKKIQSALDGAENCSVQVLPSRGNDLILQTRSTLPAPLNSLVWRAGLHRVPPEQTRSELVVPLVWRVHTLSKQKQQLIHHLSDKDNVISKLLDKLESTGTDIADVFPGIAAAKSSRKATSRDGAAKQVKGLGKFDEQHWRQEFDGLQKATPPGDAFQEIFEKGIVSDQEVPEPESEWWKHLSEVGNASTDEAVVVGDELSTSELEQSQRRSQLESTIEDDEFQRQSTPTAFRRDEGREEEYRQYARPVNANDAANEKYSDSETESEDGDLDTGVQTHQVAGTPDKLSLRSPSAALDLSKTASTPKRLGRLGGSSRQKTASPSSKAQSEPQDYRPSQSSLQAEPTMSVERHKPNPKGKLGVLGGRKKERPQTPESYLAKVNDGQNNSGGKDADSARKQSSPNLNEASKAENDDLVIVPDRGRKAGVSPKARRETSEERADKRRAELKRQLEEKAKAPTKKKRRF